MKLNKNIWRQRQAMSAYTPWGYAFEVYNEDTDAEVSRGWRRTEEGANAAADRIIADKMKEDVKR